MKVEEEWRPIEAAKGYYEVSNLGRVRSMDRLGVGRDGKTRSFKGRDITLQTTPAGYPSFTASLDGKVKGFMVHRLVALTFLERVEGCNVVDHINGDRTDNRAENLRWVGLVENAENRPYARYLQGLLEENGIEYKQPGEYNRK